MVDALLQTGAPATQATKGNSAMMVSHLLLNSSTSIDGMTYSRGVPALALEGRCPAQSGNSPIQTHPLTLADVFV